MYSHPQDALQTLINEIIWENLNQHFYLKNVQGTKICEAANIRRDLGFSGLVAWKSPIHSSSIHSFVQRTFMCTPGIDRASLADG